MNQNHTRLNHEQVQQAHQQSAQQENAQQRQATQFATAEEAIRHDAAQAVVPPSVAQRLQESVAREPKAARPWWRRWLGQPG